ncbi:MAG: hypothetical protein HFI35_01345 [Roseburia sp.]|nr:hypothetical protein [Roseburia sp.]
MRSACEKKCEAGEPVSAVRVRKEARSQRAGQRSVCEKKREASEPVSAARAKRSVKPASRSVQGEKPCAGQCRARAKKVRKQERRVVRR